MRPSASQNEAFEGAPHQDGKNIQQTPRRTSGYPPRTDLDLIPRSDCTMRSRVLAQRVSTRPRSETTSYSLLLPVSGAGIPRGSGFSPETLCEVSTRALASHVVRRLGGSRRPRSAPETPKTPRLEDSPRMANRWPPTPQ
eukprot:6401466-Pyramimonas_sp.AAC.1